MFHVLLTSYEIVGKHLHEFTKLVSVNFSLIATPQGSAMEPPRSACVTSSHLI